MEKDNITMKCENELFSFKDAAAFLKIKEQNEEIKISEGVLRYYAAKERKLLETMIDENGKKRITKSELLRFENWYKVYKTGIVESAFSLDWDETLKILPTYPYIPNLANPNRYKKYAHRPCFLISNKGNIINSHNLKKRKPQEVDHGYMQISLYNHSRKGTQPLVHQLVALLWCPNHLGKWEIHHIDGNPKNNVAINLLWVIGKQDEKDSEHYTLHRLLNAGKMEEYNNMIEKIKNDNSYPVGIRPSRVIQNLNYPDNQNCYMYVTPESYDTWIETKNEGDLVIIGEAFFNNDK